VAETPVGSAVKNGDKPLSYWDSRKHFNYYQQVLKYAKKYVPQGHSVLDVGGGDCNYISWFSWIPYKEVVDIKASKPIDGVVSTRCDFLEYKPKHVFDLVLCLQVLEHLEDPRAFCDKLLSTGQHIIVSVPYQWPEGTCVGHIQDPVDEKKLQSWMRQPALEKNIVTDGRMRRLVAIYKSGASPHFSPGGGKRA
jgi:hypothetical protein